MKQGRVSFLRLLVLWVLISAAACKERQSAPGANKVFIINSYHKGYPASDSIMDAATAILDSGHIPYKLFYLDTKNQADSVSIAAKVREVLDMIMHYQPDLIITSDDAAIKYLVVPWFNDVDMPIVFCGVNWSAAQYHLSQDHITGMLEVLPLHEVLQLMQSYYPAAKKLTVLSEQSLSEQRNIELLDTLYTHLGFGVDYKLVDDFDTWKRAFKEANKTADLIYLPTNGAIRNWDKDEAISFVADEIRKPVVTCDDFMMLYAVLGFTKVASEQGAWAANTAIDILHGKKPADIPYVKNKQSTTYFNSILAEKIGFVPKKELISRSKVLK